MHIALEGEILMKKNKFDSWKSLYKEVMAIVIVLFPTLIFIRAWVYQLNSLQPVGYKGKGNWLIILVYIGIYIVFFKAYGAFKIGYYKYSSVILSQILALITVHSCMTILIVLIVGDIWSIASIIGILLEITITDIICCIVLTYLFLMLYVKLFPPYQMIEIYGSHENKLKYKMATRADKYEIVKSVDISIGVENIQNMLQTYDAVLINDIPSELKNRLLKYCYLQNIRVYYTPKISDIMVKTAAEIDLFDTPLFLNRNYGITIGQRFCKRLMDIMVSVLLIVLSSPIMLITALAIKIEDGGPVFFRQERCTINGKKFMICKFRSMVVDAEKDGKSRPAGSNDDRITKVGNFIRKTRIDELPQLFNILSGDMSLVGPRPERVEHVEKYSAEIPEFVFRLKVKGGLTGYAQVYGKYNTTAYDKLKYDLMYIQNYSLKLDFQTLVMTIKVIFMKESTEGFEEEAIQKIRQENK